MFVKTTTRFVPPIDFVCNTSNFLCAFVKRRLTISQIKLKGDKSGRKGQLSVATEVQNI